MPSPNSTFTEAVTTTLRNHPKVLSDNLSKHNGLFRRLHSKGKLKTIDGGTEIVRPLEYVGTSNFQRYSGYDTLNVAAMDTLTAANYAWKQAAVHVTASGYELRINSGRDRIIDLAKARTKTALAEMANNLASDAHSAGSLTNQMGGLQHLITTDGTGTVGGIVAGTYTWWKNQFEDHDAETGNNFQEEMEQLWLDCVRGNDAPDLIVLENSLYSVYWASLTNNQRYMKNDNDLAKAGFKALQFNTADVIHESTDSGITASYGYFLNTEYLELVAHKDANMAPMAEKESINQDAVVIPIIWQGNLVCSNRARQGVIFN